MNILEARRRLLEGGVKKRAAEGNPIVVRSLARMYPVLNIYGWSKQDGTPTPENPVPIVSAGDEGEINVTVQGGNLFDSSIVPKTTRNGITFEWLSDEKCFLLNGTSTKVGVSTDKVYFNLLVKKGATYTVSTYCVSGEAMPDGYAYFGAADKPNESNNWRTAWLTNDKSINSSVCNYDYITAFWFYIQSSGVTFNNYKVRVVLNAGSTALPYMPYKQPQTLTAQTPGGLPGIPVSSGGNYTDENGQQWICDEVDFKRGKYVQRVGKEILNGNNNWVKGSAIGTDGSSCYYFSQLSSSEIKLITHFKKGRNYISQCSAGEYVISDSALYLMSSISTIDEFKSWLNEENVIEYYALASPIETDLSDEEIAAYKALHTYIPATTVSNDAGAWMKVGYKTRKSLEVTT